MRYKELNPLLIFRAMAIHSLNTKMNSEDPDPTDKRPQREEHKKDEAVEEYISDDPNEKPEPQPKDPKEEEMGRSDKAKKQPSDERDRYMDQ
ncbi:hypothetical protein [Anditalea andensis]|uniref:Uncharacterized protein n=1 Tax=Anditalea andensis TaxID=1048983 RepID=A0A074LN98_9BACT|nr:hypothetical protein [Anditalea andensis]KEO75397.1 hypothetical protein EL17_01510 [Anditalea andensis]